ncbi:alpha-L-fucosidase [Flexithrix dorotheae]|uniref:alpha-L-fucosidase n=1 Tax=Flexithrix dorotheae TaxID=70993 RepID=UPI00035D661A|nr:alpha-L-fucosidase [Flexithrix dorotheae]
MKTILSISILLALISLSSRAQKYEPNWESLSQYETPQWFSDAKFGVFIHWGVMSVPEFKSEWYGYHMYRPTLTPHQTGIPTDKKNPTFEYHKKHYGDQSKFGYKDFVPLFKAEKFNATEWIDLFDKAGAKYVVPVGEHCDGFAMYASSLTCWNSKDMGPQIDVLGELANAARAKGMKVGSSSHLAYGWYWWNYVKGYDTMDPQYRDLYNEPHTFQDKPTKAFKDLWYKRAVEMVEKYELDLIWFDFGFCTPDYEEYRKKFLAHYYNKAEEWNKEVVLNYKKIEFVPIPDGAAVLDLERGKLDRVRTLPWQTDTSIGRNSWTYVKDWQNKPADELVDEFVDIVSKNGNLLLNVGPKADGTIPEDQQETLLNIGKWLKVNGEGIYGTRPWFFYGEGPTRSKLGDHTEYNQKSMSQKDIRFTTRENFIYVFVMDWPTEDIIVNSMASDIASLPDEIKHISLLGSDEKLSWEKSSNGLIIAAPKKSIESKYAYAFKIELEKAPDGIYKSKEKGGHQ